MFYNKLKDTITGMIDEILVGKEECEETLTYHLIRELCVPVTVTAKMIYHLDEIVIDIHCPFLMIDPDIKFQEVYRKDNIEDELNLLRLIAKFTSILDRMKLWIANEAPDMIRWGEGVIFDKNGKTKKLPINNKILVK